MNLGLIGKKIKMLSYFENTINPVTKIKILDCYVIKHIIYNNSILIGYNIKSIHKINKSILGILPKNIYCTKFKEFKVLSLNHYPIGKKIKINIFKLNEYINVTGISKGKGFQGVVKKFKFSGVGGQTHGQHNRLRTTGSIGAGSSPSRVFKGKKMPGKMGNKRTTIKNLKILKINYKKKYIYIKGSIPGSNNKTNIIINKICL
ncbi:MAG: 50S ribosomal protein L3 [Candidatus Shikimatogenerans sp. AspAUS03]|uniref:50S ribosomal protein L3 n=1 Tax=Candidatus Shikimatogenerans sp. AspAUS03 TaxID=3158563 RepID=A0AAU7QS75_9FLAO